MNTIIILRGIQGSGKSTWARIWVNQDSEHRIRINKDDIRRMLGKYWVPSREKLVNQIQQSILYNAINNNFNIVIDNMNLNDWEVKKITDIIAFHNNHSDKEEKYKIKYKTFFDTSLEECIERDSKRENPIGEEVIKDTFNKYKDKFNLKEKYYDYSCRF